MKGTLEFDLLEEDAEFRMALDGGKYLSVLQDLDNVLRNMSKYESIETVEVMKVRGMIQEFLEEYGLTLWT